MDTVKFTIIMPVYNVACWLCECLNSLLTQTHINWTCICVDDGSTDASGEILDDYSKRDKRFVVVHQENAGVAAARNTALKSIDGGWVVFVDADDILPSTCLESYCEAIEASGEEIQIVRGETVSFTDGEQCNFGCLIPDNDVIDVCKVDLNKVLPFAELSAMLWGCAIRAEDLPHDGFRPYTIGEDRLFIGSVLANVRFGVRIMDKVYGYRLRRNSAMTSAMSVRKERDLLGFSEEWLRVLDESEKFIDPMMYHEIGISVTEWFVYNLGRLRFNERPPLWGLWWDFLGHTHDLRHCFSLWTRIVMSLNDRIHCRLLARLTCALPLKIKLCGIHR